MTRVLLVDDHAVVREGLALLIGRHAGLEVIAETGDAQEAVAIAAAQGPDVVLMDIGLGDEDGVSVIEAIHARSPAAQLVPHRQLASRTWMPLRIW